MVESAIPEGLLPDPRVHAAWAHFFSRFISAYKAQVCRGYSYRMQGDSPWNTCTFFLAFSPRTPEDALILYLHHLLVHHHHHHHHVHFISLFHRGAARMLDRSLMVALAVGSGPLGPDHPKRI